MNDTLKQLDEKIEAYKKAKEALSDMSDDITSFAYKNRKVLRKEFLEELHEKWAKAYGKEYADKQLKLVSSLTEVQFCSSCSSRTLGHCHCESFY